MDIDITKEYVERTKAANSKAELKAIREEFQQCTELGEAALLGLQALASSRAEALEGREEVSEERALRLRSDGLLAGTFFSRIDQVFRVEAGFVFGDDDKLLYSSCCRLKYVTTSDREKQEIERERKRQRLERDARCSQRVARQSGDLRPQPQQQQQDESLPASMSCRTGADRESTRDVYRITYDAAKTKYFTPAIADGQSRTSVHSSDRLEIWKTAAVGSNHQGQIAHLVPAGIVPANSYWFVTDFLFGIDRNRDWNEITRLIHGSNDRTKNRVNDTGIKHMVINKVLLAGQKDYFDVAPCVLIVPILPRDKALGWTGGAYDAIMLVDEFEGDENQLKTVNTLTGFIHYDKETKEATPEDLQTACQLLRDYTRAICYAQRKKKPPQAAFSLEGTAVLPRLVENCSNCKVRKISFQENSETKGHPSPDPLLLVTKAVSVFQKRHGHLIVAAVEPVDDYVPSEQSIQAEEQFLISREKAVSTFDPIGLEIVLTRG